MANNKKQKYLKERYGHILKEMEDLMLEYGLEIIPFKVNGRLTRVQGRFVWYTDSGRYDGPAYIELATVMLAQEDEVMRQILLHETAHYITYAKYPDKVGDAHGKEFVDTCKTIGCTLTGPSNSMVERAHTLVCSSCGGKCFRTDSLKTANKTIDSYISGCCDSKMVLYSNQKNCNNS